MLKPIHSNLKLSEDTHLKENKYKLTLLLTEFRT